MADNTFTEIPCSVEDLELQKFKLDDSGKVVVKTTATGTFSPTGLNVAGLITEVTLNATTWSALPATALTNRNAISIQNQSDIEIKLNYDNTESGYVGVIVAAGGERFYDITDSIPIYAKSASGTPTIVVEEIS